MRPRPWRTLQTTTVMVLSGRQGGRGLLRRWVCLSTVGAVQVKQSFTLSPAVCDLGMYLVLGSF